MNHVFLPFNSMTNATAMSTREQTVDRIAPGTVAGRSRRSAFTRLARTAVAAAALAAAVSGVTSLMVVPEARAADAYPSRPVTLVVPYSAGGPTDIVARTLGASMEKSLGQSVVIDNKPGAGGTIGMADVAKAAPDGYRILIHHIGMATSPALYRKLPFKVEQDFAPVGLINDVPMMMVARADFPTKDLKALIQEIKARPDQYTLANAGVGAASHLCGLLFMSTIGTDMTTVPYKGAAPAIADLIGGQVNLLCDQSTNTTSHLKSGKIKAFAVTTPKRLTSLPDIPTSEEAGLPGFQVSVWHAAYAPKGTPQAVIDKLSASINAALGDPALIRKFEELGAQTTPADQRSPAALQKHLQTELARWAPIIQKAGVYAD